MKQFLLRAAVVVLSLAACVSARAANLSGVKTVYLLPMSNGLDQYLAVQLTTDAILQVVTDPQKADAVFTDHLGESFERAVEDLYAEKNDKPKSDSNPDGSPASFARSGMQGQRGRGTAFLVDRKSHEVLWSVYERPKDNTPDALKRVAGRIASKLANSIKGK
jgi:hypothetical protein